MRKYFRTGLLVTATMMLVFSGCKSPEPKTKTLEMKSASGLFVAQSFAGSSFTTNVFKVNLATVPDVINAEGTPTGIGEYIRLWFCSTANLNDGLPAGEYQMGTSAANGTIFQFANNAGNVESMSDHTQYTLVSGTATVKKSGNTYTIECKFKDGTGADRNYHYEGAIAFTEYSNPAFDYEPKTVTNQNFVGTTGLLQTQVNGTTTYNLVTIKDNSTFEASILALGANLSGTFPINFTGNDNTVAASKGAVDGGIYYSFVAITGGYYFLQSGNVTFTQNGGNNYTINVVATSYFGSTINISFEGDLEDALYDPEPRTPTTINATFTQKLGGYNYGNFFGNGGENLFYVFADDEQINGIYMDFVCSGSNLTTCPTGTYTIDGTATPGTVCAYTHDIAGMGGGTVLIYGNQYFIMSGVVIVTGSGCTMSAYSYFGSQININYSGSMTVQMAGIMPAHASKFSQAKSNLLFKKA